jgi:hypothetical protein
VSTIKGIGISVSFDTYGTQVHELRETSGGEKSLLALALIFALQKCPPVPFCVIDEADSVCIPINVSLHFIKHMIIFVTVHIRLLIC